MSDCPALMQAKGAKAMVVQWIAVALLMLGCLAQKPVTPQTFYLSPDGDDHWSGTRPFPNAQKTDGPMRSLAAALQHSRQFHGTQLLLRGGAYPLEEPLVLTARDSGLA